MDFRLRCLGCGLEAMTPRFKAEKASAPCSGRGNGWTSSKGEKPSTGCGTAPPGSAGKFGASGGKRLPFYIWHRFLTEQAAIPPGIATCFCPRPGILREQWQTGWPEDRKYPAGT
ncbi:MAG: hypothetical protein V8T29_01415 [Oscillospiraceae bacterium]